MKPLFHVHQVKLAQPQAKYSHQLEITDEGGDKHWIVADVCTVGEKNDTEDEYVWTVHFVRVKGS